MTWQRIQLSRRKGARMPPNSRSCARPSRWGNPRKLDGMERSTAQRVGREWFHVYCEMWHDEDADSFKQWLEPLRSVAHLACWCAPDQPCHVDVLIEWLERVYGEARSAP